MRVVGAVGVVDDAAAFVGFEAVLVDDPFEGGAVAEAVVEGFGRDAVEGEEAVVGELGPVFGEAHLFDAPVEGGVGGLDLGERVLGLVFVVHVDVGEAGAGCGEGAEVGGEGDAGQLAFEVGLVAFAVDGVMEKAIDVVEDVPLGDGVVAVVGAEAVEGPVGDVLAAVGAVLGVGVEGEALGAIKGC